MATNPERTNYFDGSLLGASDLTRDQQYLIGRLRGHNRFAHGWGVLQGLTVSITGSDVIVDSGFAIDCEGNEVGLLEPQRVAIGNMTGPFFVCVKFVETPVSPTPGPGGLVYAAIVEGAQVELSQANACAGHSGRGPGTPGCGHRHAVVLARVSPQKGGWQVRLAKSSAKR
jgi:hypothetical protein